MESFDDGILWVTLGEQPDLIKAATTLYAGLTDERPEFASEDDAANKIAEKLGDRTCLLVIDNVWSEDHLKPFVRGGKHCARVITTRFPNVSPDSTVVDVDKMNDTEAAAMLEREGEGLDREQIKGLLRRLGNMPLALEAARTTIRARRKARDSATGALHYLETALTRMGPGALPIEGAFLASFELLSAANQRHLTELSIFPPSIEIPLAAVGALWKLDEFETETATAEIVASSLMRTDLHSRTIALHDVLRGWLQRRVQNACELHCKLVDAWPDWYSLPHEYAWRWLVWHLGQAGRRADIARILWDPLFIKAKLEATDVNGLIAAYEYLKPSGEAELMQGTLRLSAHVLARDKGQLRSQLAGRIGPDEPQLWALVERVPVQKVSLTPAVPTLLRAGQALWRIFAGHSDCLTGVAVTVDGQRAISASSDGTLKVWDLDGGSEPRTLEGHTGGVNCVAMTANGQRAISGSSDGALKVWDLDGGSEPRTLEGHTSAITAVAITPDGRRAISSSFDGTLRVWDLDDGAEPRTVRGPLGAFIEVAIMPDGQSAACVSFARETLNIWDLEGSGEAHTIIQPSQGFLGVVLTAGGRWAISWSWDQPVTIWDLDRSGKSRTLPGHSSARVNAAGVSADGRLVVCAFDDNTLRVWDLESGDEPRTLGGHSGLVTGIAVAVDGRRAVSASWDRTLKVWDLKGGEPRRSAGHGQEVSGVAVTVDTRMAISTSYNRLMVWDLGKSEEPCVLKDIPHSLGGVAMTPDGRLAVAASGNGTLTLWDLEGSREPRTLKAHTSIVTAVALTPDARRVASASWDGTVKVWDLECEGEPRILNGHMNVVTCVAIAVDGRRVISGSRDKTVKVWDLEDREICITLQHSGWVLGVALAAYGRRVISASADKTLKVWDLEDGREAHTLAGHLGAVNGVALTADGRRAVSASEDHTLKLWDLEDCNPVSTFTCDAAVTCCAFANDRIIVCGDKGGAVHFLKVELEDGGQRT